MAAGLRRLTTSSGAERSRSGLTLAELLVAAALSVIVIGAVASLFAVFSRTIRHSQATVDLGAMMRGTAWQLRQDLAGLTCPVGPWIAPADDRGYFELLEGPRRDLTDAFSGADPSANLTADTDDVLLFTTQTLAEPFVGRFGGAMIESPYAEVAWFCRPLPRADQRVPGTTLCALHRRQLLVINYLGRGDLEDNTIRSVPPAVVDRSTYDVSLRRLAAATPHTALVPNSLGDLSKRENRFLRDGFAYLTQRGGQRTLPPGEFPHAFPLDPATGHPVDAATLDETARADEDVLLRNVIAFDVRVFDPRATSMQVGDAWRLPGDPGYVPAPAAGGPSGAYVDLGWGGGSPAAASEAFPPVGQTAFQSAGCRVSDAPGNAVLPVASYDTWSRHYEFNGVDDDHDGIIDEASNGIDANEDGWPEATGDTETMPPYPLPLRGLEIRLRCYEPISKQIRQLTIRHAFTP
jgi:hypothetical protein